MDSLDFGPLSAEVRHSQRSVGEFDPFAELSVVLLDEFGSFGGFLARAFSVEQLDRLLDLGDDLFLDEFVYFAVGLVRARKLLDLVDLFSDLLLEFLYLSLLLALLVLDLSEYLVVLLLELGKDLFDFCLGSLHGFADPDHLL